MRKELIICDGCKREITYTSDPLIEMKCNGSSVSYVITKGPVSIEDRKTDFCKYCLIDAFNKLDDRVKATCNCN